jgi:hypothetical protein
VVTQSFLFASKVKGRKALPEGLRHRLLLRLRLHALLPLATVRHVEHAAEPQPTELQRMLRAVRNSARRGTMHTTGSWSCDGGRDGSCNGRKERRGGVPAALNSDTYKCTNRMNCSGASGSGTSKYTYCCPAVTTFRLSSDVSCSRTSDDRPDGNHGQHDRGDT